MRFFKKALSIMTIFVLVFVFFTLPSEASYKNCKFLHGMEKKYGFGKTTSTRVESSMKNVITVSFSDNTSYTKTATSGDSTTCIVWTDYLGKKKGNHSCKYYVNGAHVHTSTKPWPFDFSRDWF